MTIESAGGRGSFTSTQAERNQGRSVKDWNVIGLTDLGDHLVERYVLTPYGELTVYQETGYGDRDGDGDVDATEKGTPGSTCTGTVSGECRILDLDFDGDYDSTDAGLFDSLPQGLARHPGRIATDGSFIVPRSKPPVAAPSFSKMTVGTPFSSYPSIYGVSDQARPRQIYRIM